MLLPSSMALLLVVVSAMECLTDSAGLAFSQPESLLSPLPRSLDSRHMLLYPAFVWVTGVLTHAYTACTLNTELSPQPEEFHIVKKALYNWPQTEQFTSRYFLLRVQEVESLASGHQQIPCLLRPFLGCHSQWWESHLCVLPYWLPLFTMPLPSIPCLQIPFHRESEFNT